MRQRLVAGSLLSRRTSGPFPRSLRHKASRFEVQLRRGNSSSAIIPLIRLLRIWIDRRDRVAPTSLSVLWFGSRCPRQPFDRGTDRATA